MITGKPFYKDDTLTKYRASKKKPSSKRCYDPLETSRNLMKKIEYLTAMNENEDDIQLTSSDSPLLSLPGEIRNKIYSYAWISARDFDPSYDIPDMILTSYSLTWKNVSEPFNLLLVNKQIHSEAISMISAEFYLEIKAYPEYTERTMYQPQNLLRNLKTPTIQEMCGLAPKVAVDISSRKYRRWACKPLISGIVDVLMGYERLGEVLIKACVGYCELKEVGEAISPFFRLAKKGVVLCFEFFWDPLEILETRKRFERCVEYVAEACGAKDAEVWIEWTRNTEEKQLRDGCVCGRCFL